MTPKFSWKSGDCHEVQKNTQEYNQILEDYQDIDFHDVFRQLT